VFASLLIANRGEIARRIIRTARRLGVRPLAVYSEADAGALHVREADDAVCIGPPPARESYLDGGKVLDAARRMGAEAIHPGYGFLSENAAFADAVMAAGLVWVGPPPAAIRAMGLKDAAKTLMAAAGVPVTPGYSGDDQSGERLFREAASLGYPVLIKAVAGGGGKGMRRVDEPSAFAEALAGAKRESASSFGDDRVLLETYLTRARHIEVQVFADKHGHAVHLFERDCSLQRRHQKVIEEAPAPGMDEATRTAVCAAAVKAAQAVAYEGAGTVEFIADASGPLRADRIWFMEMNTRLQVEHPVTEAITGLDLVEWQLRVAAGEPLPLSQDQIRMSGHAIEARLYAEDPAAGFLPSVGELSRFDIDDEAIRVDSGFASGQAVSPYYDPMLAKLIAHAPMREAARAMLAASLRETVVYPVRSNAAFLVNCLEQSDFAAGAVDTGLIEAHLAELTAKPPLRISADRPLLAASGASAGWLSGFRLNAAPVRTALAYADGAPIDLPLAEARQLAAEHGEATVFRNGAAYHLTSFPPHVLAAGGGDGDGTIRSPMPGKIALAPVAAGDAVVQGQTILVLEAMKMEHALTAPFDGAVSELSVEAGQQVREGAILARVERSA
jgi:3-methylcrotonyl-CoA carboxylase alpha subunit